jgi:hypothetical protein
MFGELSASLSELDEETRFRVARFMLTRNEYLAELIKLNGLQIAALTHPSPMTEAAVKDFNETVIIPLRRSLGSEIAPVLQAAVDIKGLKSFLPSILMGLLQFVNVPLVLSVYGVDPDMIEKLVREISTFIRSDM